jgi:hypothetical protein
MSEARLNLFLLPRDNSELPKTGIILYLTGLAVTFLYYVQFNILSVDLIKPQSIIVGIYVWICAILVPRLTLLCINEFAINKKWANHLLFVVSIAVIYAVLLVMIGSMFLPAVLIAAAISLVQYVFHLDRWGGNLKPAFSRVKTYCHFILLACLFGLMIYPNIPQYAAGGKPLKVEEVVTKTAHLPVKSKFSKSIYLLYESDKDYYFFEERKVNLLYVSGYSIRKVNKTEISLISFYKPKWFVF